MKHSGNGENANMKLNNWRKKMPCLVQLAVKVFMHVILMEIGSCIVLKIWQCEYKKKPTSITYPTACKVPTRKIIKPEQTLTKPQVYFQDLHRASFFLNGPFGLYFQLGWISLVLHLVENPSKLYVPSFFLLKLSYTREVLIEMLECKIVQFCCNVIFNSNSF